MCKRQEQWKEIEGWPAYQVSNLGNVRRVAGERNLRPTPSQKGYLRITLQDQKRRQQRFVHDLIAKTFIGQRPEGSQINHKDCQKSHNCDINLEYVTPLENTQHAWVNGLVNRPQKNANDANQYYREKNRATYHRRRAAGLCIKCGIHVGNRSRCVKCYERYKTKNRNR